MGNEDRNDLAFWFEKLKATGVPVPSTTVVRAGGSVVEVVYGKHSPHFEPLVAALKEAAAAYGYPVFLRSGHGSGKHDWKDTCFVPDTESMGRHVAAIIEWSECVDMLGLPTETWVVREALPLVTTFRAFSGQMPINKERRYFIRGGRVVCHHPYWPPESIRDADCGDWQERLALLNTESESEVRELTALSERVSVALEGAWSLDWAATVDGRWIAIDMAVAAESFHWEACPERERLEGRREPSPPPPNYDELFRLKGADDER